MPRMVSAGGYGQVPSLTHHDSSLASESGNPQDVPQNVPSYQDSATAGSLLKTFTPIILPFMARLHTAIDAGE